MIADGVLAGLKLCFLALLYLFFARALRAVLVGLRQPEGVGASSPASGPGAAPGVGTSDARVATGAGRSAESKATPVPSALLVKEPKARRGTRFAIDDELTIGRAPGCHVSLPDDAFVSQLHARVYRRSGKVYIEDLGSTNGTVLNGGALRKPTELRPGDRIKFGDTTLELVA